MPAITSCRAAARSVTTAIEYDGLSVFVPSLVVVEAIVVLSTRSRITVGLIAVDTVPVYSPIRSGPLCCEM